MIIKKNTWHYRMLDRYTADVTWKPGVNRFTYWASVVGHVILTWCLILLSFGVGYITIWPYVYFFTIYDWDSPLTPLAAIIIIIECVVLCIVVSSEWTFSWSKKFDTWYTNSKLKEVYDFLCPVVEFED